MLSSRFSRIWGSVVFSWAFFDILLFTFEVGRLMFKTSMFSRLRFSQRIGIRGYSLSRISAAPTNGERGEYEWRMGRWRSEWSGLRVGESDKGPLALRSGIWESTGGGAGCYKGRNFNLNNSLLGRGVAPRVELQAIVYWDGGLL
jgi:hypothetical protein